MLVRDFIRMAYKIKKDGGLPKQAISFLVKHSLKENEEKSERELILISQSLSNADKRINIITTLLDIMEGNMVIVGGNNTGEWRSKTYKQVAKELHPDSETGDTDSFQFLQEIKEFLWDCEGNPRKEIVHCSWEIERRYKRNGLRGGFTNV